ncbi:MAG: metallophosphoesterase [Candidatus Thorarchaeota archaeon]
MFRERASWVFLAILIVSPSYWTVPTSSLEYTLYNESALLQTGIIRGPTVNLVTNHSAMIFWRTTESTDASVKYGLNESLLEQIDNSTLDTDHRVMLENLKMDSIYHYQVVSAGISSPVYDFKTAPADGDPFKLIVIGDNRPGMSTRQPWVFGQLAQLIAEERPHLVVFTGDYVWEVQEDDAYNDEAWTAFTDISDSIGHYAPLYGVVGNHDDGQQVAGVRRLEYFLDAFELPDEPSSYYSFDYAGVHFSCLDTEEWGLWSRITGEQYDWLVDDLASTPNTMKFVFAHQPLYPVSHINSALDMIKGERDRLQDLFEAENVTAFFAGHDHCFNRMTVNGVVHLIVGGGGARLYDNPWGGAYNHYLRADINAFGIDFVTINRFAEPVDNYEIPFSDEIEIEIRPFGNESRKPRGTLPEFYFSRTPSNALFSWDSTPNTTVVSGFPETPGRHSLDVYAENDDNVWSHKRYLFNTSVPVNLTQPTTTNDTSLPVSYLAVGIVVGGIGIGVVVVLFRKRLS